MKKPILHVDMDDTICHFKSRLIELHPHTEPIFGNKETLESNQIIEAAIMASPRIFLDLEPMDDAVQAVKRLSEYFDIYFLSSPFWELPESFMDKRIWLENHFGELAYKRLILSHRKDLSIGEFLVDDRIANGAGDFTGRHIHFGTESFPDWEYVEKYLMAYLNFE